MKTLRSLIGAALIAGSSIALAAEPALLEEKELDGVTAGFSFVVGHADADAGALAAGILATTSTHTDAGSAAVVVDLPGPFQYAGVQSGSESSSFAGNFQ